MTKPTYDDRACHQRRLSRSIAVGFRPDENRQRVGPAMAAAALRDPVGRTTRSLGRWRLRRDVASSGCIDRDPVGGLDGLELGGGIRRVTQVWMGDSGPTPEGLGDLDGVIFGTHAEKVPGRVQLGVRSLHPLLLTGRSPRCIHRRKPMSIAGLLPLDIMHETCKILTVHHRFLAMTASG
jgi:hypothetical protein